MTNYTAEDFAVAKFAEHPVGHLAMRAQLWPLAPWLIEVGANPLAWGTDQRMSEEGWVPVSPNTAFKKRITRSEMDAALWDEDGDYRGDLNVANSLGIEVVPDPGPTNAEKLAEAMRSAYDEIVGAYSFLGVYKFVADSLDKQGVKAPGGEDVRL